MPGYDPEAPTSDVDSVRLLISDVATPPLFADGEIERFLSLRGASVNRAAALALRTIAANEALLLKHIQTQGLTLDGSKVARELRALAEDLEADDDLDGDEVFMVAKNRDGYDFGGPRGATF
jgi:hypothetical protein